MQSFFVLSFIQLGRLLLGNVLYPCSSFPNRLSLCNPKIWFVCIRYDQLFLYTSVCLLKKYESSLLSVQTKTEMCQKDYSTGVLHKPLWFLNRFTTLPEWCSTEELIILRLTAVLSYCLQLKKKRSNFLSVSICSVFSWYKEIYQIIWATKKRATFRFHWKLCITYA